MMDASFTSVARSLKIFGRRGVTVPVTFASVHPTSLTM